MIIIVCGPTCSGKTSAAKRLSNYYHAPIINADAFQVYQDMNIGTAKISKDDEYYSRHYLLDIIKPNEEFSVSQYQELFRKYIEDLQQKYENIIVCGGTGLYIRAAIYDYKFEPQEDIDVSDLEGLTNEQLYEMLKELDSGSCDSIHMNNRKRVIRAIAIARSGNMTRSENINSQKHKLIYDDVKILMINPNREKLYEQINSRVETMFDEGLVDEVKYLLNKYNLSKTARAAIGYKEVIDYLNGDYSLDDCKELIKKRTRNYAKRQVTFFKNQFELKMYDSAEDIVIDNCK